MRENNFLLYLSPSDIMSLYSFCGLNKPKSKINFERQSSSQIAVSFVVTWLCAEIKRNFTNAILIASL